MAKKPSNPRPVRTPNSPEKGRTQTHSMPGHRDPPPPPPKVKK